MNKMNLDNHNPCPQDPLVSVIIPVYKVEAYLDQCIQSVRSQTYTNLEIWLIDDGSPDRCPEMCDRYAAQDPRIHVIHQENQGQGVARNAALDRCTGAWIAFVDSDDWIDPDTYMTMLAFAAEKDLDCVYCAARVVREGEDQEIRFREYPDRTVKPAREILRRVLEDEIGGQPWKAIYKRKCWEKVRFPAGMKYEDLAVSWLPFTYTTGSVGFLEEPLYHYRMNPKGSSLGYNPKREGDIFYAFCRHYEYACAHIPQAVDQCLAKCLSAALLAYNSMVMYPEQVNPERVKQAQVLLADNRKTFWRLKTLPIHRKVQLFLYFWARPAYNCMARYKEKKIR